MRCRHCGSHLDPDGDNCGHCPRCDSDPVTGTYPDRPKPTVQDVRVAFKELSVEDQEACLRGIVIEHNYYRGLAGRDLWYSLLPEDLREARLNHNQGTAAQGLDDPEKARW